MAIFWEPTVPPGYAGFSDAEFFSYQTEAQPVARPEFSRSVMRYVFPETFYRRYVSKWTNFREGASHYYIMFKKITRPEEQSWSVVDEFDPLPSISANFKQFSVNVNERGVQFPLTLRAKIFSNIDLEAEVRAHVSDVIKASIEKDLLLNAFVYLDVLGLWIDGAPPSLEVYTGVSLNATKTFASETVPITINQYNIPTTTQFAPLNMNVIREFAYQLLQLNAPSYDGDGYGRYLVIVNHKAWQRLTTDPEYFTAVTRLQDREAIRSGYLGHYYGFEFVLDTGRWIDRFIVPLQQQVLQGKSICLFLSQDAVREAIIRPEEVKTATGDFGRFMSVGVFTYRGESPTWFTAEGQAVGGWLIAD